MKLKYILFALLIVGCKSTKTVQETVTTEKKISYALPGRTEISLKALCDTLNNTMIKTVSGPVETKVITREGERILVTQYDTIFKEKIVYKDRVLKEEVVRKQIHWGLTLGFLLAGFVIGFLRPWRWITFPIRFP